MSEKINTDAPTGSYQVIRCEKGNCRSISHELIAEEPLLIRIDENPYSVVMRTPGEEIFHAAGFCLGEGIVDSPDDFLTVGHCEDIDPNVIDIRLKPERRDLIPDVLERRGFVSQTSCGICGKELIKDLYQRLTPAEDGFRVETNQILDCVRKLDEKQKYYERTRGSHAAMLFDGHLNMISLAEDVGRHNALDKAIGKAFLNGKLPEASIAVLSSRISYELVQKAARAHVPMMISRSRPTALATEMCRSLNMTLACVGNDAELIVVSGKNRIVFEPA